MAQGESHGKGRTWGLVAGLLMFGAVLLMPAPADIPLPAWHVLGVALLMAAWWISEALPLPVTALAPIVLFPLLSVATAREAATPYADPIIFLFLGGFIIGTAMQRWSLHKRVGLKSIALVGATPRRLIAGFMLSTAILSMWVSNSATAIMMLPVALSVLALYASSGELDEASRQNMSNVLLLSVAYGASIGGLGTLIGTPPNALLAAYMAREHGVEIGFARWMLLGVPLVLVMLAGSWLILTRLYPVAQTSKAGAEALVGSELRKLGPATSAEKRVACVFGLTALAWITRPLFSGFVPGLDDSSIAIAGAVALFLLPSGMPDGGRILIWDDLRALPWGVLILFGGGLSLASAISSSGLATWVGAGMQALASWPALLIIAIATIAMIFLTEITSNTASAAAFIPLGGAVAVGLGFDPLLLTIPLALAASCAFMLPVATPPNAIVFSSERISIGQMARAGLWLNLFGAAAIIALSYPAAWLF